MYLHSAYPGLSPYRDSGDMAAGALTLGVSHPPGYPLYLLFSHLWVKSLPLGSIAFRLNILSAAAGAAACWVLASMVRKEEDDGNSALTAFLLLGLAPAFWHLSLVSEMYSANALVAAGILWLMQPVPGPVHRRRIYAGALLFGLGLGNHQTLIAALPAYLWVARGELFGKEGFWGVRFWRGRVPALFFFALTGFAIHAYLPLRASAGPVLSWGDPESLRGLYRMLTRADLGSVRLHPSRPAGLFSLTAWLTGVPYALRLLVGELGWPGLFLLLWGTWTGRRSPVMQGSLIAFLLSGPIFIVFANLDPAMKETYAILEPHLVLPLVFGTALAGMGAGDLLRRASVLRPFTAPVLAATLLAGGWAVTQSAPAAILASHRRDFSAWDYGKGLHSAMGEGALVLDPDDPTAFTLSYMALAHHLRPDILPLLYFRTRWGYKLLKDRHPELLPEWEIQSGQELLGILVSRSLKNGRDLYLDLPQKVPAGYMSYPAGLVYRVMEKDPDLDQRLRLYYGAERARHFIRMREVPSGLGFFTQHTIDYWSSSLNNLGIEAQRNGWPDKAVELYQRALAVSPDLSEAWNNMGNSLLLLGEPSAAEGCYRISIRLKPAPAIIYNLGRAFLLANKYPEAEAEFHRAIELGGPREARNDLGLVYLRTKRYEEAVKLWVDMLDEDPYYLLAYYNAALAYEAMGRHSDAYQAVAAYVQLVADPREKEQAAAWMRRLRK